MVWAYMGPPALRPPPPDYELVRAPATHRYVSKTFEECNWLQALEGGIDTSHSSFLHNNEHQRHALAAQPRRRAAARGREAPTTAIATPRSASSATTQYVRVYHYVMPAQQMRGARHRRGRRPDRGAAARPATSGSRSTTRRRWIYNWMYGVRSRAIPLDAGVRPGRTRPKRAAAPTISLPGYRAQGQPRQRLLDRPRRAEDEARSPGSPASTRKTMRCRKGWGRSCDRTQGASRHVSDRAIILPGSCSSKRSTAAEPASRRAAPIRRHMRGSAPPTTSCRRERIGAPRWPTR